ncbi:MAG: DUF1963 domain-containing protein [Armatimonadetes bacterium]|nr:DUF1963 domain-containing protein [Armatimonadota bacterium]
MAHVTKEMLRERFDEAGLESFWPQLEPLVRPAILVKSYHCSDATLAVGQSKRWGAPDLPPEFVWPERDGKPCPFLCQINLAEVAVFDTEKLLPEVGMLSFFLRDEFGLGDIDGDPVYYFPPGLLLERRGSEDIAELLYFRSTWSVPNYQSSGKLEFLGKNTEAREAFESVADVLYDWGEGAPGDPLHHCVESGSHLLGHADDYQGDHEPECELAYLGVVKNCFENRPENYCALLNQVELASYQNWLCLLKDADCAGGVFTLNCHIRRNDLAQVDFSKTITFAVN